MEPSNETDLPSTGVEGQNGQFATTTRTAQINGPVLVANPKLAFFDCLERRHHIYENGAELHLG